MTAGFKSRIARCLRRFSRAESGVTAIEFAFIAPVVLLMSGIMLETGSVLFSEYSLQSGVQRAARDVKIGTMQGGGKTLNDFRNRICTLARAGIKCSNVNVYLKPFASFNSMYTGTPNLLEVGSIDIATGNRKANFGCGDASQAVVLVATYDWDFSLGYFMKPFGNINGGLTKRLVGLTVFQNEPFTTTTKCSNS